MERVSAIDELRDEIYQHANMASLVALDQVSRGTQKAARSFTYPRRVVMRSFKHFFEDDRHGSVPISRLVGCRPSETLYMNLLHRGPQIASLHLRPGENRLVSTYPQRTSVSTPAREI